MSHEAAHRGACVRVAHNFEEKCAHVGTLRMIERLHCDSVEQFGVELRHHQLDRALQGLTARRLWARKDPQHDDVLHEIAKSVRKIEYGRVDSTHAVRSALVSLKPVDIHGQSQHNTRLGEKWVSSPL